MKQLCKDIGIKYNLDLTTSDKKNSIVVYDRGVVIKEISKKDKACRDYHARVYHADAEADIKESLYDELPSIFAVVSAMIVQGKHELDVCEYLAGYVADGDRGDLEIDIIEKMVRKALTSAGILPANT